MKGRHAMIAAAAVALLVLGSCELALGPRSEGTIVLNLGGGPSSRAFSDAPFDDLPVFSSVTVTVSGSGMPTASQTVPGNAGSVTIQVPAGPARKVEVYAVADWASTPQTPQPTLAKAYGGTVVVDVAGGQKVPVSMNMDVVETKILLPDSYYSIWSTADSITSAPDSLDWTYWGGFFQFDRYGRLITLDYQDGLVLYNSPFDAQYLGATFPVAPFVYDPVEDGLYIADSGSSLTFVDSSFTTSSLDLDQAFETVDAIAVDDDGFIYLAGYDRVVKFRVDHDLSTATQVRSATYESLGLGYWTTYLDQDLQPVPYFQILNVQDMIVKDGRLFIAVAGQDNGYYHGKIVEVHRTDLTQVRDIGWSPTSPTSPATQFYGPTRFLALAPRKLILSDEGYIDGPGNVNRVIAVDIIDWTFSGIGLEDVSEFFYDFGAAY